MYVNEEKVYLNRDALNLTGYRSQQEICETSPSSLFFFPLVSHGMLSQQIGN